VVRQGQGKVFSVGLVFILTFLPFPNIHASNLFISIIVPAAPSGQFSSSTYVGITPKLVNRPSSPPVPSPVPQDALWNCTYGGEYDDWALSVVECDDGGFLIVGRTNSSGAGGYDVWVVRTDASGIHLWNRTYGGTGWDGAYSVVECRGGGFAVAGVTESFGNGMADIWLLRLNATGYPLWNQTYGKDYCDYACELVECSVGGFALAGRTNSSGSGRYDFWLIRTDGYGNQLWERVFGGSGNDGCWSMVECNKGGFALAGYTGSFGAGGWDLWLVCTDMEGVHVGNHTYGGVNTDEGWSVVECSDGGFAIAGRTSSYGAGYIDMWLVRIPPRDPHDPIIITSDADFSNQASYEGWSGDGTAANPYIIENLDIDHFGANGYCISIYDTTVYFIIRNCLLHNATSGSGIFLSNVTHGQVINNTCTGNDWGIALSFSDSNLLENNTCTSNANSGIWLSGSDSNNLTGNICADNWRGIELVTSSSGNVITNNTCTDNTNIGLYIADGGDDNSIRWNIFDNPLQNTEDDRTGLPDHANIFDHNYYSDYNGGDADQDGVGDGPYTIPGDAGNTDSHPLMYRPTQPSWVEPLRYQLVDFNAYFYYDLNATAPAPLGTWWINDTTHFSIDNSGVVTNSTSLGEGTYWVRVTINNLYGVTLTGLFLVTVQPNAPPMWLELPSDQVCEYGDAFRYDLNATDPAGIDRWWINDTVHFVISGAGVITNATSLAIGVYGVAVWVNDTLGSTLNGNFTVTVQDTCPPDWVRAPADQWVEFGDAFHYSLNATDLSGLDWWWINDTTHFHIDNQGTITNGTSLPVNVYYIQVWVNDTWGNCRSAVFTVTVQDTTPPSWLETPTDRLVEFGDAFHYSLNATDLSGLDRWWINDTTHFHIDNQGTITNATGLPVGVYFIQVWVNDTYGNVQTATLQVKVQDTTPPVWIVPPMGQILECGEALDLQLEAWDLSGIDHWAINDTVNFAITSVGWLFTPGILTPGRYGLSVTVYDPYDNSLTATITILVQDTLPPKWSSIPSNQVVELGFPLNYDLDANDPSGIDTWWLNDTVHFTINESGLLSNATFLPVGVYSIQVWVNDTFGHILTGIITITVQDTTPPKWRNIPPSPTIVYGQILVLQLEAWDLSGIAEWTVNDTEHFTITATGLLSSSSLLPPGSYVISIAASDPYGNTLTTTITVTVQEVTSPTFLLQMVTAILLGVATMCVTIPVLLLVYRRRKAHSAGKTEEKT